MKQVRIGVIGVGNMGTAHCRLIASIDNLAVTAVADVDAARCDKAAVKNSCPGFHNFTALLDSGLCDAVLVATPHFDHTTIGIQALKRGLHLLVEKPISAHKGDCEKLIRAYTPGRQIFAAMFNQRTDGYYRMIRDLIQDGSLGNIRRIQWTITDWFRAQSYYDSGGWRATWAGEGGGVLLNQCPHQLDLLQWLFGMPVSVRAIAGFGKYHQIEVEDEVTTLLEFDSGATGVFTTTTGEAPGINRLEIAGENGLVIYDTREQMVHFHRNSHSVSAAIADNRGFEKPEVTHLQLKPESLGEQHLEVLKNFANAILHDEPLIAPAEEGQASVELANAMLLSAARDKKVSLPISARTYARHLRQLIEGSEMVKPLGSTDIAELTDSF